ncbi:MAG TPA: WG repeat-containing protein [Propionicimonas sp.]|nr:WG repeat-containing protein [Propionicimonas sp.]HQD96277.1 WG repeat-containing protein [Propionicimonas sp.]
MITLLTLAGCVATGPAITSPPTATSIAPSATGGTSAEPSAPASSTIPGEYRGSSAMPAADGDPMLWPTIELRVVTDYGSQAYERYGFVDVNGQLVVKPRFDNYQYCPDAHGRAAFVIGERGDHRAEVLDLTGKLMLRTPAADAGCAGSDHVVFTDVISGETGEYNSGVLQLSTGRIVVPLAKDRHIEVVQGEIVNVSDPEGEYFLDLSSGARTPHPGWLWYSALEPGAPGLPAAAKRPDYQSTSTFGYVSLAGQWLVEPRFADANPFVAGRAIIGDGTSETLIDADFNPVSGPWTSITVETDANDALLGYHVFRGEQEGLLGPDANVILPVSPSPIYCNLAGACTTVSADGLGKLVLLPELTRTDLPAGLTKAISRDIVSDSVTDPNTDDDLQRNLTRLHFLADGRSVTSAGWSFCDLIGTAWVMCAPSVVTLPPDVFDTRGNRTTFRSVRALAAASGSVPEYYWAVAGRYQGLVDATGAWRYRESRFTQLED